MVASTPAGSSPGFISGACYYCCLIELDIGTFPCRVGNVTHVSVTVSNVTRHSISPLGEIAGIGFTVAKSVSRRLSSHVSVTRIFSPPDKTRSAFLPHKLKSPAQAITTTITTMVIRRNL
jgi:hypothetical protein